MNFNFEIKNEIYGILQKKLQGEEIGMLDNRDGISFEETLDLGALNVGKNGSWKYFSRDPARKFVIHCFSYKTNRTFIS